MGSSHGQTTPRRTRVSSPHMSVKVDHLCRSTLDEQQASRSFVMRVTVVSGKEQRRREEGEGEAYAAAGAEGGRLVHKIITMWTDGSAAFWASRTMMGWSR